MSTTAYYNFITGAGKRRDTVGDEHGSGIVCDVRRQAANSPSSYVNTSTSTSSSSLNQYNSFTNNTELHQPTMIQSNSNLPITSCPVSCSSSSSSSSSTTSSHSSSSNSNYPTNTTNLQQTRRHSSLLRQTSITPTQPHHTSQLTHSCTLHSLEPKPFKPFKSSSEYLEAMKEDLAEWFNRLYSDLDLTPDNFFASLDNGAIICRHANHLTQMGRNTMHANCDSSISSSDSGLNDTSNSNLTTTNETRIVCNNNNNSMNSPSSPTSSDSSLMVCTTTTTTTTNNNNKLQEQQHSSLQTTSRFSPRSLLSHNNSINWFNIKIIPFKQDAKAGTFFARDNICQFILWCRSLNILECLLFETDDLVARKNEKSFILCLLEVARIGFKVGMPTPLIIQLEQEIDREIENDAKLQRQLEEDEKLNRDNDTIDNYVDEENYGVCDGLESYLDNSEQAQEKKDLLSIESLKIEDDKKEEALEVEEEDTGPKPQVITNDLVSLHEKVVQLLCQCTCPTQFPMVRVGDNGKYKVGDKLIIFVRILRRHIMVRVGGGWQELSEFLRVKDPCRSKQSYHSSGNNVNHLNHNHHNHHHHHHQLHTPSPNAANNANNLQQQTHFQARIAPNSYISYIPTSASKAVSKSRLVESSHHLNKGHHQFRNGQRLISGSASMSWLSHNS